MKKPPRQAAFSWGCGGGGRLRLRRRLDLRGRKVLQVRKQRTGIDQSFGADFHCPDKAVADDLIKLRPRNARSFVRFFDCQIRGKLGNLGGRPTRPRLPSFALRRFRIPRQVGAVIAEFGKLVGRNFKHLPLPNEGGASNSRPSTTMLRGTYLLA